MTGPQQLWLEILHWNIFSPSLHETYLHTRQALEEEQDQALVEVVHGSVSPVVDLLW